MIILSIPSCVSGLRQMARACRMASSVFHLPEVAMIPRIFARQSIESAATTTSADDVHRDHPGGVWVVTAYNGGKPSISDAVGLSTAVAPETPSEFTAHVTSDGSSLKWDNNNFEEDSYVLKYTDQDVMQYPDDTATWNAFADASLTVRFM